MAKDNTAESQKRAMSRYRKSRDAIYINVPLEEGAKIRAAANMANTSLAQFLIDAALSRIEDAPVATVSIPKIEKIATVKTSFARAKQELADAKVQYEYALRIFLSIADTLEGIINDDDNSGGNQSQEQV